MVEINDLDKTKEQLATEVRELRQQIADFEASEARRRRLEEALRESEERYRSLFDRVPMGINRTTPAGKIIDANLALVQILGYPDRETLLCINAVDTYADPHDREQLQMLLEREGTVRDFRVRLRRRDGKIIWARSNVRVVQDEDGRVLYYEGSLEDITAHVQAQKALQRRTYELGERVKELNCLYAISNLVTEPEISLENVLQGIVDLIPSAWQYPEVTGACITLRDRTFKTDNFAKTLWRQASDIRVHGDQIGCVEVYYLERRPESDEGSFLREERSLLNAITERLGAIIEHQQADREIQRRNEELIALFKTGQHQHRQLRALTARLSEVEEIERQQLARELHDQVGQNLTALGINLNVARAQVSDALPLAHEIRSRLDDSLALVGQTAERIRDLMADLRPPVLDDYGLVAALRWYGEKFASRTGVDVAVRGEEPTPRLATHVENALFRVVQEALTNVARYAQATQAMVTLDVNGEAVRLAVSDNGVGFDSERLEEPDGRRGWGLLIMAERAEAVGGHFYIESLPQQGTQVVVEVTR